MANVRFNKGPTPREFIRQLLTAVGRPFLNSVLFLLYTAIVLGASFLRLIIYLIKLVISARRLGAHVADKSRERITRAFKGMPLQAKRLSFPRLRLPKPHKRARPKLTTISILAAAIIAAPVVALFLAVASLVKELPDPNRLKTRDQIVSTKIYDRNGNLLFKIFKNENRTPVELRDIPGHMIQTTIAIEDKDFYQHAGYSYKGMLRALQHILLEGEIQGGSTITQQLVKNALLTKKQTLERKAKEVILSILTETRFTKDEILSMYFNEVGYGGAAYGIEEAAQLYFGKSAEKLTLAEAALLAGLPAAPTRYSPFGTHPELAKFRQHEVLRRMVEDGYITIEQAEQAKAEKLILSLRKTDINAPHFVMFVKELLVEKFGEQLVEQGGLEVTTSLDLSVQNVAQLAVSQEVKQLETLNITNGAALVTRPTTGEILAMVGSHDFFDFEHDGQVNVTLRPRQPGSAIKPVNYAVALENGFTAATILSDTPITYHIPGQPPYTPRNYDGSFHGRITLRNALANSYNVPAVKTLSVFGVDKMIQKGKAMGISTWEDKSRYGLSLTLGGGEVTMADLAVVYGALANRGNTVELAPILRVRDYRGQILFEYSCPESTGEIRNSSPTEKRETCIRKESVRPEVAFILSDILSDNQARTPAFGPHSALVIPNQQVAVKTGTTQNLRDNWTIGYTDEILVATWVGNNDNSAMSYVASGLTGASPIWNRIISGIIGNTPNRFQVPETVKAVAICSSTGTLPCETCPGRTEYFIPGSEPVTACIPDIAGEQEEITLENLQSQAQQQVRRGSFERILDEIRIIRNRR